MSGFLLVLDSVDPPSVFSGLHFDGLAGYGDGTYDDIASYRAAYPDLAKRHHILEYAVHTQDDGDAADCELGDMTVDETVDVWLPRQFKRGAWRPAIYANKSRWLDEGLRSRLEHYGNKIRRIVAWYTYRQEIDSSILGWADGQQFSDRFAGRNIDGNVVKDTFFEGAQPPKPRPTPHYDLFTNEKFHTPWGTLSERYVVEQYDRERKHDKSLPVYEKQLEWFAKRVACQANFGDPQKNGHPNWKSYHRGSRFVWLTKRSHGVRFV
jgi:hypothetical protein